MSINHDELVNKLSTIILRKYNEQFKDVFISNVSMDFPKPDFVYIPFSSKKNKINEIRELSRERDITLPVAFEVKTPFVNKHEYLTGLGQAIAYNSIFPLSYLVIPDINKDGFQIKEYLYEVITTNNLKIGIFSYQIDNLESIELVKKAEPVTNIETSSVKMIKSIRRSYSYWRETKPEEVFDLLKIAESFSNKTKHKDEEDLTREVLEEFWEKHLKKRFKSAKGKTSFQLNYKLFLIQNSLIDAKGRLTLIGKHTLFLGKHFSNNKKKLREIITYIVLKYGGHYILLSKIYEEQLKMDKELSSLNKWLDAMKKRLDAQNYYISKSDFDTNFPRLPYAYEKYFCGIMKKDFKKHRGFLINFPRIYEIMETGKKLFEPVEKTLFQ